MSPVERIDSVADPAFGEPVIAASGLGVRVGHGQRQVTLVEEVSFSIAAGERVGLIGESGSGKSLTGLALMGLLPEDLTADGSIRLATNSAGRADSASRARATELVGLSERELARHRGRDISMVFQEPMTALNPTMRIGDQVAESMIIHRTVPDRRAARARALDLLAQVQLPDPARAARAYPHELSGGQRQRVVLAIALANDPALLVCDEPTTALDVTVQKLVLDLIISGVRARDAAMLFITHDLGVVARVCERVLVMYGGRIVESGSVAQVFTRPRHRYTQGLLAASDLTASGRRARLHTIPGTVPAAGRFPAGCVFRTRCAHADAVCEQRPGWLGDPDSGYACHHPAADVEPSAAAMIPEPASPRGYVPAVPPASSPTGDLEDPGPPAIVVRGVTRTYPAPMFSSAEPVRALRGISLQIGAGERFGIVGESGCGKSTLLRILAGLDAPTSGEVLVGGTDIARLPERRLGFLRKQLQLVLQDPMSSLDPRMRVAGIVAEPLVAQRIRSVDGRDVKAHVAGLLDAVALQPESADRFPHQFSGGQRQRISIARALAPQPGILLADEPVSALDVSVRAQVLNLINDLVDRFDLTLVFVSHDLSVVRHVCDRVAVMHNGEVVEVGATEQVYNDPQHDYTKTLLAAVPDLRRELAAAASPRPVSDLRGNP